MSSLRHTHDHSHAAPEGADARLTPWRRQVLDILKAEGRAMGAYDIIARIAAGDGRTVAPIQVYRALDHLLEHGLIHRLASRNAYLACGHGHCAGESVAFLICDRCGDVAEATSHSLKDDLARLAASEGFSARAETIEITGRCARCGAG